MKCRALRSREGRGGLERGRTTNSLRHCGSNDVKSPFRAVLALTPPCADRPKRERETCPTRDASSVALGCAGIISPQQGYRQFGALFGTSIGKNYGQIRQQVNGMRNSFQEVISYVLQKRVQPKSPFVTSPAIDLDPQRNQPVRGKHLTTRCTQKKGTIDGNCSFS